MLDAVTKKETITGEEKTVTEIIDDVLKDVDFYEEIWWWPLPCLVEKSLLNLNLPNLS